MTLHLNEAIKNQVKYVYLLDLVKPGSGVQLGSLRKHYRAEQELLLIIIHHNYIQVSNTC